jgi:hypothetical protein
MNIRQLLLDVDKAVVRPSLLEIAAAIDGCRGVEAVNITVEEIDIETVGMNVTIEGDNMDYEQIVRNRLDVVAGLIDGILNALTLAAGRLARAGGEGVTLSLALRVSIAAGVTTIFVFLSLIMRNSAST